MITAQALGLVAFPIAYHLLPFLRDRGLAFAKPLGLLLLGYLIWILSYIHLVPNTRLSLVLLLLAIAAVSGVLVFRSCQEMLAHIYRERHALIVSEVLFLLFFVGWLLYRAYDSSIGGTEKPMDFAFLNASLLTRHAPPEDPWLIGHSVAYYYFGYWMMAVMAKLTAVPSYVSYNLALALIPAMAASAVFGLVYDIVRVRGSSLRPALMAGGAGVVLLLVIGNLEGLLELVRVRGLGSDGFWEWMGIAGLSAPVDSMDWRPDGAWWFHASRVINTFDGAQGLDFTIQEFPFFSVLLGDLHPHLMSTPFLLLFLAFALNLLLRPRMPGMWGYFKRPEVVLSLGLVLGALAFINIWDLPIFGAVLAGVVFIKHFSLRGGMQQRSLLKAAPFFIAVLGLAFILYLPFYTTFGGRTSGVLPILPVDGPTTRYIHFLVVWGLFLAIAVPFALVAFLNSSPKDDRRSRVIVAALVVGLPLLAWAPFHMAAGGDVTVLGTQLLRLLPLILLGALAMYSALGHATRNLSSALGLLLLALASIILMGSELFYLTDVFNTRMNTVFKLYYQAWVLLAVVGAVALHYLYSQGLVGGRWTRWTRYAVAGVVPLLLLASLYYTGASLGSKGDFRGDATLDGLVFLKRSHPDEYGAIAWLYENASVRSGILEAVGGSYSDFGRISSSTGIPTVLGWPGHELQWRGSSKPFDGRVEDLATIYQTEDPAEAKELLDKYGIRYVYAGRREREKYGESGLPKFHQIADLAFSQNQVAIYRLRE